MTEPPQTGFLQTKDYLNFRVISRTGEPITEFQGGAFAGKALPGDMVNWNPETKTCKVLMRTKHHPIVGVLELASKTKYGMTSRGAPMYLFAPCRAEYPFFIVGCSERNTSHNQLAVIDFEKWDTTELPRGNLRQLLGRCDNFETQKAAALLTFNPFKAPKGLGQGLSPPKIQKNRARCPTLTFNIDPQGCWDIDDVLSIQKITEDRMELWITIADVAEAIQPNTEIDEYAARQALTAYENGTAVRPMLPAVFSEGHCSLLPDTEKHGVSLILEFSAAAPEKIINHYWRLTWLNNRHQFSYDDFKERATILGIPVDLLGAVASGILGRKTDDTHEWIEAFMLKYNMEAAELLRQVGRGVLRKHEMPDYEKLALYTSIGGPDLAVLANRSAVYCEANDPAPLHYGLKAQVYCHATSPIRRYADLLNQRVIKDILLGTITDVRPDIIWLNQRQRDMKQYERDLFFLCQIEFCKSATIDAIVLKREDTKMKLWIPAWKLTVSWKSMNIPDAPEGAGLRLSYFTNPAARRWKDRIVFHFIDFSKV